MLLCILLCFISNSLQYTQFTRQQNSNIRFRDIFNRCLKLKRYFNICVGKVPLTSEVGSSRVPNFILSLGCCVEFYMFSTCLHRFSLGTPVSSQKQACSWMAYVNYPYTYECVYAWCPVMVPSRVCSCLMPIVPSIGSHLP